MTALAGNSDTSSKKNGNLRSSRRWPPIQQGAVRFRPSNSSSGDAPMSRASMRQKLVCLNVNLLEERRNPSTASPSFLAIDLISDQPGVAAITDPTLLNAWGISLNPNAGAFWISSNHGDLSEVYGGDVNGSAISQPFKVAIPGGSPTGQVFNSTGSTTDFSVTDGTTTKAAVFIFASEAGQITGWNPGAAAPSKTAEGGFTANDGAIYKGLALGQVGGRISSTRPISTTARST